MSQLCTSSKYVSCRIRRFSIYLLHSFEINNIISAKNSDKFGQVMLDYNYLNTSEYATSVVYFRVGMMGT